jgi:hypothetical protein
LKVLSPFKTPFLKETGIVTLFQGLRGFPAFETKFHLLPKLRFGRKLDLKLCYKNLIMRPQLKLLRLEPALQQQFLTQTAFGKEDKTFASAVIAAISTVKKTKK